MLSDCRLSESLEGVVAQWGQPGGDEEQGKSAGEGEAWRWAVLLGGEDRAVGCAP